MCTRSVINLSNLCKATFIFGSYINFPQTNDIKISKAVITITSISKKSFNFGLLLDCNGLDFAKLASLLLIINTHSYIDLINSNIYTNIKEFLYSDNY